MTELTDIYPPLVIEKNCVGIDVCSSPGLRHEAHFKVAMMNFLNPARRFLKRVSCTQHSTKVYPILVDKKMRVSVLSDLLLPSLFELLRAIELIEWGYYYYYYYCHHYYYYYYYLFLFVFFCNYYNYYYYYYYYYYY